MSVDRARRRRDQHQRVAQEIDARTRRTKPFVVDVVHPIEVRGNEEVRRRARFDLLGERVARAVRHDDLVSAVADVNAATCASSASLRLAAPKTSMSAAAATCDDARPSRHAPSECLAERFAQYTEKYNAASGDRRLERSTTMTAKREAHRLESTRRATGMSTAADVRMQGFRRRSEVPAVLAWIDQHASQLAGESVPIEDAMGRVLASDVVATDRRAGIRSLGDGRLWRARRRHLGRERVQPHCAARRRPGASRAAARSQRRAGDRRSHHDRRSDSARRRRRRACGIRARIRRAASRSRGRLRPGSTSRIAERTSPQGASCCVPAGACVPRMSRSSLRSATPTSTRCSARACASSPRATRWSHPAHRKTCTRSTTRIRTCFEVFCRATAACSSARFGWATILPSFARP